MIKSIGVRESGNDATMFLVQAGVDKGLDVELPFQGIVAEHLRLLLGCLGLKQVGETSYGFFDTIIRRSQFQLGIKCFQVLAEFAEEVLAFAL